MNFSPWHSRHGEQPLILVPEIGLELSVRLPPEASGGALTVIDTINSPGFGPPLHRHAETEVFTVVRGRYLVEVDGRRFLAEEGDVVSVPGGMTHAFVNVTDQPARQTVLILPGLDAKTFFTELGSVMKQGPGNSKALDALGRRWGVEFLGPPLVAAA